VRQGSGKREKNGKRGLTSFFHGDILARMTAEDSRFPAGYNGRMTDRLPRKYEFFQDFYASLLWQRGFSMFSEAVITKI
jgi:hypothetical protein